MGLIVVAGRKRLKKILVWLFLLGVVITGFHYRREIGRAIFPIPFRDSIVRNAHTNRLDPELVAAVITVESGFNPNAVSARGAVGLMQVMPETGEWVGQQAGRDDITSESLRSHETNIYVGTWYLRYLLDQLNQDEVLTLAAYNAGWNRVQGWQKEKVWSGKEDELHQIPFPETRKYVQRVLWYYRLYNYLYPDNGS